MVVVLIGCRPVLVSYIPFPLRTTHRNPPEPPKPLSLYTPEPLQPTLTNHTGPCTKISRTTQHHAGTHTRTYTEELAPELELTRNQPEPPRTTPERNPTRSFQKRSHTKPLSSLRHLSYHCWGKNMKKNTCPTPQAFAAVYLSCKIYRTP